ncbi:MAG: DNA primase [Solirubrobacterales bacterium]
MSRFTPDTIERVREAADIVEIVSAYTDLRRQGERFVGLCPFHEERTPSFSVKPRDGFYYCFGCEAGGDTIRFVQEKEGLGFADAVEALADRYGVEVERESEDPKAEEARRRRGRLGEVLERVAAFYESYLWESPKAAKARAYLIEERGLGEEILRGFGVGFAPSAWDSILTRGQRAGFSVDELLAAGLIQRSQKTPGSHYDRFRGRITFPVRDHRGRVVGFGARGMGPDAKPKYLNSPESEVYRKSRTLYGIDRARGPIARGGRAVVVEGYTDVIALHGAGVEEAVAVMGTAITPDQLKLLGGYAEEVVLALDADRAGREAMLRAQRVAGSGRLRLLVAAMPEGEDPADMMRTEGGSNRLRGLLADAVDLAVFHVRAILDDADLTTPPGRDRALDEVVPVLVGMGETITRQEMVREVADRLDAAPELVASRMKSGRSRPEPRPEPMTAPRPAGAGEQKQPRPRRREPTQEERREAMMLALCMDAPETAAPYLDRLGPDHFTSPILRSVFERIRERPDDPLEGLGESESALINAITRLRALDHEPATKDDLEFRWMLLERDRLDRALRHPEGLEPADLVAMQKQRGRLADAISSVEARGIGGAVPGPAAR